MFDVEKKTDFIEYWKKPSGNSRISIRKKENKGEHTFFFFIVNTIS